LKKMQTRLVAAQAESDLKAAQGSFLQAEGDLSVARGNYEKVQGKKHEPASSSDKANALKADIKALRQQLDRIEERLEKIEKAKYPNCNFWTDPKSSNQYFVASKRQGSNKANSELQGIWLAESVTVNGRQREGVGGKIAFVGGQYLATGNTFPDSGTFVLGKETMALDLTPTQPPPGESRESPRKASDPAPPAGSPDQYGTLRCIYELKGDTLRICSAQTSADARPKDFTAGAGSKRVYLVYRRLRP